MRLRSIWGLRILNRGNILLVTLLTLVLVSSLSIIVVNTVINSNTIERDYGKESSDYYKIESVKSVFMYGLESVLSNKVVDVYYSDRDGYFVDASEKVIDNVDTLEIKELILSEMVDGSIDVYIEIEDKYFGSFCGVRYEGYTCDKSKGDIHGVMIVRSGKTERRFEINVSGLGADMSVGGKFGFDMVDLMYDFWTEVP